jgi:hypothetical protein
VDREEGDGGDSDDNGAEHDDDEPCGAFFSLWRGLSDPHGVDKGVRDEQEELHVFLMRDCRDGSRSW